MLTLPIKQEWFDMICRGEKREEYREATEYYQTRINSAIEANCRPELQRSSIQNFPCKNPRRVQFKSPDSHIAGIASSAKAVCANGAQTRTNTTISCKFCNTLSIENWKGGNV